MPALFTAVSTFWLCVRAPVTMWTFASSRPAVMPSGSWMPSCPSTTNSRGMTCSSSSSVGMLIDLEASMTRSMSSGAISLCLPMTETTPRELTERIWSPATPTKTDSICSPAITSASSTAFFTASMAWSRLMMLPRRVPFIGAVPLPMISSWLRSLISPTSTHTFDVPMSRATMYFSSVLGIGDSSVFGVRRQGCRFESGRTAGALRRFDDDAVGKPEVGVLDGALPQPVGAGDGVEAAPLGRDVLRVGVDIRAEVPVEEGEAARRDRPHLGDAREDGRIARPQHAQERDGARELGAGGIGDEG